MHPHGQRLEPATQTLDAPRGSAASERTAPFRVGRWRPRLNRVLLGIAWIALLSPLSVPLLPLLYVDPASAYGGIAILGLFILLGAAGSLVAMLLAGLVLRRTPSPPERQLAGATLFVPVAALTMLLLAG